MKKKKFIYIIGILFVMSAACVYGAYLFLHHDMNPTGNTLYIYVDEDDTTDSISAKIHGGKGFMLLAKRGFTPRTGCYAIYPGADRLSVFRMLRNGQQTPIKLTIPSVRTLDKLASALGEKLMLDSAVFAESFHDTLFAQKYGFTKETLPALFIPNTYEMYWNVSLEGFMKRIQKEYDSFWTKKRQSCADSLGLSRLEVSTLASIVDSETANDGEKPKVAGMYVNRLKKRMLLQADPTVIFAIGDFSIRRVLFEHLKYESPYNTYLHIGLPPGPIRIPTVAGIDAVLHCEPNTYLYMCAKEDFSGTHNFAKTLSEHLRNAKKYQQALNKRKINK